MPFMKIVAAYCKTHTVTYISRAWQRPLSKQLNDQPSQRNNFVKKVVAKQSLHQLHL
jgi:hypothetical protein